MTNPNPPVKRSPVDFLCVFLSSVFFLSFIPAKLILSFQLRFRKKTLEERRWTGAGLVGAVAGILTFLLLPERFAESLWMLLLGVIFSVAVSHRAEKVLGVHDDSRIVIDEWIGAWIAVWGLEPTLSVPVLMGFLFFRFWDVYKGPWGHALQKLPGGLGIVFDDVGAGIVANLCVRTLLFLVPHFRHH